MKKIAIPINDQGILDSHFGHCKYFAVIETDGTTIKSSTKITPPPHEPGLLPKWLSQQGINAVIAGGMGQRAIQLCTENGIDVHIGATKESAELLVENFLNGSLILTSNHCDH